MADRRTLLVLIAIGVAGGFFGGLFGVGGGVIMVPALVALVAFSQHQAHATSLAAILPIAVIGALRFGLDGEIAFSTAAWLALGTIVGAPVGAKAMFRLGESALKGAFGLFMIVVGIVMVIR